MKILGSILLAAFVADQPAPRISGTQGAPRFVMGVETVRGSATTFWVKLYLQVPDSRPDSLITEVRAVGATAVPQHRLAGAVVRDSFAMVRPAATVRVAGSACAAYKYGATQTAYRCVGYSYTEPAAPTPPPVIDSVRADTLVVALRILPRSVTGPVSVTGGATTRIQFCPVFTMGDGKRVMPSEYQAIPYCRGLYEAAVPLLERGTSAQVRQVDQRPVFRVAT